MVQHACVQNRPSGWPSVINPRWRAEKLGVFGIWGCDVASFSSLVNELRAATTDGCPVAGFYEFAFPYTDDFQHWLPEMLDHPNRWQGWISKRKPEALFNQIIHREQMQVRLFPPGTTESCYGVYMIGDADEDEIRYIGKSQDRNTAVAWRLIDHFFPGTEKYCAMYANIKREQNTPWFWDEHIALGKKLQVAYCDNIWGPLLPDRLESDLRTLVRVQDGDYPRYDGHSAFARNRRRRPS